MAFKEDSHGVIRDEHGRWVKGQTGNPAGRMPKQLEERIRVAFDELMTDDLIRGIIWNAIVGAVKDNDKGDREFIFRYTATKPAERLDVTTTQVTKGYAIEDVSPDAWPSLDDTQPAFPIPPDIAALDDIDVRNDANDSHV